MSFTRFGMNKNGKTKKTLKEIFFTFLNGELFRFELNAFEPCLMRWNAHRRISARTNDQMLRAHFSPQSSLQSFSIFLFPYVTLFFLCFSLIVFLKNCLFFIFSQRIFFVFYLFELMYYFSFVSVSFLFYFLCKLTTFTFSLSVISFHMWNGFFFLSFLSFLLSPQFHSSSQRSFLFSALNHQQQRILGIMI